jgi:DNA polymerase III alpha subunit (gram-positive type)
MNKKVLLYTILSVFAFVANGGAVYANTSTGETNPMSNLVTAIAQKFNLNQADVQSVFNEHKSQMSAQHQQNQEKRETEMKQKFSDELAKAVTSGKLTQAQADLITAKRAELDTQRGQLGINKMDSTKTAAEREALRKAQQEQMQTKHEELKKWASDNGIPSEYLNLMQFRGEFGGGIRRSR